MARTQVILGVTTKKMFGFKFLDSYWKGKLILHEYCYFLLKTKLYMGIVLHCNPLFCLCEN